MRPRVPRKLKKAMTKVNCHYILCQDVYTGRLFYQWVRYPKIMWQGVVRLPE